MKKQVKNKKEEERKKINERKTSMKCLNVCKNKGTLLSSYFLLLLLTQQNFILIQADTAEIKIKKKHFLKRNNTKFFVFSLHQKK